MMRKALWIGTALFLFAAIVTPCAKADSVTFTCTGDNNNSTGPGLGPCLEATPTAPDVTFQGPTLEISWYTAANPSPIAVKLMSTWKDTDKYSWLASNSMFFIFDDSILDSFGVSNAADTTLPSGAGLSETGTLMFNPGTGVPLRRSQIPPP